MPLSRSPSPAQADLALRRERMLGPPRVLAFAVFVITALALLHRQNVMPVDGPDGEAAALGREQIHPADKPAAPSVAIVVEEPAPVVEEPAPVVEERAPALSKKDAARLEFEAQEQGAGRTRQDKTSLLRMLESLLAYDASIEELQTYAAKALALGDTELALRISLEVAAASDWSTHGWFADLARQALAAGEYRSAADFYFLAQKKAPSLSLRREYFITALRTLQSGNLLAEAILAANRHGKSLERDRDTLVFLIKLARSANRPAQAEKYADKLMRLSGAFAVFANNAEALLRRGSERCGGGWIRSACAAERPFERIESGILPFNDEVYSLAFDVYLANRNLARALLVAQSAVRQAPDNQTWRRRLAQVAEWSGQPRVAIEQWAVLARYSDDALDSVLRLAPGLFDDENVIAALELTGQRRTLTQAEWQRLAAGYEGTGAIGRGLSYLREANERTPNRTVLELLAGLLDRSERNQEALAAYQELVNRFGDSLPLAMKRAHLWYLRGSLREAFLALQGVQTEADASNSAYWRALADLSWLLNERDTALAAHRALLASGERDEQYTRQMIELLRQVQPDEAAELAAMQWRSKRQPTFFLTAIGIAEERKTWKLLGELFSELSPGDRAQFSSNAEFFSTRANYHRAIGRTAAAFRDYRQALDLNSSDDYLRADMLWLLVEHRTEAELIKYLRLWAGDAERNETLRAPIAAAYTALGQPERALPFYRAHLQQRPDDYLWMLNYADALEQAGQANTARRMRRHAWTALRPRLAKTAIERQDAKTRDRDALESYTRLALLRAPDDSAASAIRELLRQERAEAGDPDNAVARELALSWLMANERFDAARTWLWQNYARTFHRFPGPEVALALEAGDVEKIDQLLASAAGRLSPSERIEAMDAVGRRGEAAQLALDGLIRRSDNDGLHATLSGLLIADGSRASGRSEAFRQGALSIREDTLRAAIFTGFQGLKFVPFVIRADQDSRNPDRLAGVPATDLRFGTSIALATWRGRLTGTVERRHALNDFSAFDFRSSTELARGLSINARAGRNQIADETSTLRLGAVKDPLELGFSLAFSRREYVSVSFAYNRYYSQERDRLAHAQQLGFEIGHRIRTDYPDVTVRAFGNLQRYHPADAFAGSLQRLVPAGATAARNFFFPENSNQAGIGIGVGEASRDLYGRGVRPFLNLAALYNSVTRFNLNGVAGASVSVFGNDTLAVYFARAQSRNGVDESARTIGVHYQFWF